MDIKNISEKEFSSAVEKAQKPVLVQFFAAWCGPCKSLAQELDALVRESLLLDVVRVNVDENNNLAERFGINNIPCMLLFKDGEVAKTIIGYRTKQQLENAVNLINKTK